MSDSFAPISAHPSRHLALRSRFVGILGWSLALATCSSLAATPTAAPQQIKPQVRVSAQPAAPKTLPALQAATPVVSATAAPAAKVTPATVSRGLFDIPILRRFLAPAPTGKASVTPQPAAQGKVVRAPTPVPTRALEQDPCWQQLKPIRGISAALCQTARLYESGIQSVEKRPLLMRDMPARPGINKPSRVLVLGAIHGDEPSAAVLALKWMQLAEEIPAQSHWRFIPALNPDGLLHRPLKRTNANGVDLNRNFPTPNWESEAEEYWGKRTKKDPRRWPGPKPLSEPETRLVYEQMAEFSPQLIVSIHAPYGVLDFDGPTIAPDKLGRLYLDQIGIFPGSLGNYGGVQRGVPVVTIELPNAIEAPNEAETRQMWLDLLRWMSTRGF